MVPRTRAAGESAPPPGWRCVGGGHHLRERGQDAGLRRAGWRGASARGLPALLAAEVLSGAASSFSPSGAAEVSGQLSAASSSSSSADGTGESGSSGGSSPRDPDSSSPTWLLPFRSTLLSVEPRSGTSPA